MKAMCSLISDLVVNTSFLDHFEQNEILDVESCQKIMVRENISELL